MISLVKSTKKQAVYNYFSSRENSRLYMQLRNDVVAYPKLRLLPYREAIQKYAIMSMSPEQLTPAENINRLSKDIRNCDNQLAAIDKETFDILSNSERVELKKTWYRQKNMLVSKKLQFASIAANKLEEVAKDHQKEFRKV